MNLTGNKLYRERSFPNVPRFRHSRASLIGNRNLIVRSFPNVLIGNRLREWLKDKRICVVGCGLSGRAGAKLLNSLNAKVTVIDARKAHEINHELPSGIATIFGAGIIPFHGFELVVTSPGVPWDKPELRKLRRTGIPVWTELELAYRLLPQTLKHKPKIIAITGTNGKTTTSKLTYAMCRQAGLKAELAGNVGTPLSAIISKRGFINTTHLVLEVSSYQLEGIELFHPDIACILNITPDHLARHHTMANYARAKARIFLNQNKSDWTIFNAGDNWCRRISKSCPGNTVWFSVKDKKLRFKGTSHAFPAPRHLIGQHNVENAMAAIYCALAAGAPATKIKETLHSFRPPPHRLEPIATVNGVRYINDSKATNVDSTMVALQAIARPVILILGGQDKGSSYKPLIQLIKERAKIVLLIGEAANVIKAALQPEKNGIKTAHCRTLENAVRTSSRLAKKGDTVLLSPACASFDQFQDFEDRGNTFKCLVHKLKQVE